MLDIAEANKGFNPCFLGTCPRTYEVIDIEDGNYLLFQSLFSWNLPSDSLTRRCPIAMIPGMMFQSLFSWNLPSDDRSSHRDPSRWNCFNPCFLGTCPRTVIAISMDSEILVSILVFLELALGLLSDHEHPRSDCFNPCFLGTCPRTSPARQTRPGQEDKRYNPCLPGFRVCLAGEVRGQVSKKTRIETSFRGCALSASLEVRGQVPRKQGLKLGRRGFRSPIPPPRASSKKTRIETHSRQLC